MYLLLNNQATVVCSSLETGPGITAVEFTNVSAPVGTTQVDVSFRYEISVHSQVDRKPYTYMILFQQYWYIGQFVLNTVT